MADWVTIKGSARGIASNVDVADLDPSEWMADALNVDLDRPHGAWVRRPGSEAYNPVTATVGNTSWNLTARVRRLIWWRRTDGTVRLVAIAETGAATNQVQVYVNDPVVDRHFDPVGDPFVCVGIPAVVVQFNKIWIAPATTANWVLTADGHLYEVCPLPPPATAPNLLKDSAVAPMTGTYSYCYCWRHAATGARSALSPVATIDPLGKRIVVGMAACPHAYGDRVEVYRTTAGGSVFRLLWEAPAATTYWDSTADAALSMTVAPTRSGQLPGGCSLVTGWKERLWWAIGSTLYWSESLSPFGIDPARNTVQVSPDDGEDIVALAAWGNNLFAFKATHIYQLSLIGAGDFRLDAVPAASDVGPLGHATLATTRAGLLWLARSGVMRFDGMAVGRVRGPLDQVMIDAGLGAAGMPGGGGTIPPPVSRAATTFQQTDLVAERFWFRFKFYTDEARTQLALTRDTTVAADQAYVLVGGLAATAAGYELGPGARVAIEVRNNGLDPAVSYWWTAEAFDGLEWTDPTAMGLLEPVNQTTEEQEAARDGYWALHLDTRDQVWFGIQSAACPTCDVAWVLDYDSLAMGGPPVWTRHAIFGTAGCMSGPLEVGGIAQTSWPLVGDANGMVWIHRVPGDADHLVGAELAPGQVSGSGTLAAGAADDWTLTCPGAAWPDVRGMLVVIKDLAGMTYTGLVCGNTAEVLTILAWLEGRAPVAGLVTFSLGGIDGRMESLWLPGVQPEMRYRVTGVRIERAEPAAALTCEVRASESPDDVAVTNRGKWRKRLFQVVPRTDRTAIVPLTLRGAVASVRLGNCEPGSGFAVREFGLRLEAVEGLY